MALLRIYLWSNLSCAIWSSVFAACQNISCATPLIPCFISPKATIIFFMFSTYIISWHVIKQGPVILFLTNEPQAFRRNSCFNVLPCTLSYYSIPFCCSSSKDNSVICRLFLIVLLCYLWVMNKLHFPQWPVHKHKCGSCLKCGSW